ncbi:MAG: cobaltochelatase subunit CobN [Peptococcaceae bacterium]|nr:cobaltochelatase subunit CobN [Peptococcaceae bacterium]
MAEEALRGFEKCPEQLGVVIWATETQTDGGATVSFALRLMGVKPVWGYGLSVAGVTYTPLEELNRPRVDVLMTTSGIFREIFPQVAVLLDRGARVALAASYNTVVAEVYKESGEAREQLLAALNAAIATIRAAGLFIPGNDPLDQNYVARHWLDDARALLSLGISGADAGRMAVSRLFGPAVGTFGTRLPEAVRLAWTWEERQELGKLYIDSMKYAYREDSWGKDEEQVFVSRLQDTAAVYHSRSTSLYGVLDVDHNFEYLGGFGLAVEAAGGKAPGLFILNQVNPAQARVEALGTFLGRELAARYLNPEWIKGMMEHGYAGAREISHGFVANLFGWDVMRPDVIKDWMWQDVKSVFLDDKYGLGLKDWFNQGQNAYSLIEITGTMLTAVQKGFWQADAATLKEIANTWAKAVIQHGPACCDCSCGNISMMKWTMMNLVDPSLLKQLNNVLFNATQQQVLSSEELAALTPRSESSSHSHSSSPPPKAEPPQPQQQEQKQELKEEPKQEPVREPAPQQSEQAGAARLENPAAAQPAGTPGEEAGSTPAPVTQQVAAANPAPAAEAGPGESTERAYEVEKEQRRAAAAPAYVPVVAVLGVVALVALGAAGFFFRRFKGM